MNPEGYSPKLCVGRLRLEVKPRILLNTVFDSVDLNVHMNLFQGDSDQRFVTRIWLDYEKQNECE